MTKNINGYQDSVLDVDLTNEKIIKRDISPEKIKKFIGGRGFNIKTLMKEINIDTDPFDKENVVSFAVGPFTGTKLALNSRMHASTLSPYTNILGDGNAGGKFPVKLKESGFDQLIIRGKSKKPKYLFINGDEIDLLDGSHIWGKKISKTVEILENDLDYNDLATACIGPAGENLVRFATTMVDGSHSCARGSGAVLGSKKLKAIVVRGDNRIQPKNEEEFEKLVREDRNFLLKDEFQQKLSKYGSLSLFENCAPGYKHDRKVFTYDKLKEHFTKEDILKYKKKSLHCSRCPIGCKGYFKTDSNKYNTIEDESLEFESIVFLGLQCGILDLKPIIKMGGMCDEYGIDTIALGNVISLSKELSERGILTKDFNKTIELNWKNADEQIELIRKVSKREGIGDLMAKGQYNMARELGDDAMDICYHVKGMSKGSKKPGITSVSIATSTRGADHLRGSTFVDSYYEEWFEDCKENNIISNNTSKIILDSQRAALMADILMRCKGSFNNWPSAVPLCIQYPLWKGVSKLLNSLTGLNFDEKTIKDVADRVFTLERLFNMKRGVKKTHDRLPLQNDLPEDEKNKKIKKHYSILENYYDERNWSVKKGKPTKESLVDLGLENYLNDLEKINKIKPWNGPPIDK